MYNRFLMHLAPRRLARTYFGADIKCDVRDMIQATIMHFGAWEPHTSRVFERLIDPGSVVVDVGANIGYFTLLFSKLVGKKGRVIAIEPSPRITAMLEANVKRNGMENVRVVRAAVTGVAEPVTLYEAPRTNIGMTTTRADRGFAPTTTVDGLPLNQILTPDEARRTRLIKIDIEGAEVPVVEQLLDTLDFYSPDVAVAVEASPAENPEWATLFDRFLAAGFRAYDLGNNYDWLTLMDGTEVQPKRVRSLPSGQADLLFTRAEL